MLPIGGFTFLRITGSGDIGEVSHCCHFRASILQWLIVLL